MDTNHPRHGLGFHIPCFFRNGRPGSGGLLDGNRSRPKEKITTFRFHVVGRNNKGFPVQTLINRKDLRII